MRRFYFDIRDGNGVSKDQDGEELSSAAKARQVALKTAGQAVRDLTLGKAPGGALKLRSVTATNAFERAASNRQPSEVPD
jgi:hypothetical protein